MRKCWPRRTITNWESAQQVLDFTCIYSPGNGPFLTILTEHSSTPSISTGNSLDKTEKDDELMVANDASVKDMEAAAIAWSCKLHEVPFLGVKVVTDIVDGGVPTQDEFLENLHAASKSLQDALPKVLDYVCGKSHSEL